MSIALINMNPQSFSFVGQGARQKLKAEVFAGSSEDDSEDTYTTNHHTTLGQMAEKVQAKARKEKDDNDDDDDEIGEDDNDPAVCQPGNEHTGRWTRKEHELFLDALKKYGKVRHR